MTPENRAGHLLETYARELGGSETIPRQARLQELIVDAIHKALIEDRERSASRKDAVRQRRALRL